MLMVGLLLIISILFSRSGHASHEDSCSSQWYVTGYFTPVEFDYSQAEQISINIEQQGESVHAAAFLKVVKIESWVRSKAVGILVVFQINGIKVNTHLTL